MNIARHKPFIWVLAVLLGCCFGAALAGTAQADEKIFAPQYCVRSQPAEELSFPITLRITETRQDFSDEYAEFVCPLIRDDIDGSLGDVWVRVFNREVQDGNAPSCCVWSVSLGASFQDFECMDAPNVFGNTSLHFTFDDFEEYEYGHYAVTCDLGGNDSIISIRTQEPS